MKKRSRVLREQESHIDHNRRSVMMNVYEKIKAKALESEEFWVFNEGCQAKSIKKIEKEMGLKFPKGLKEWLTNCNGGYVVELGKSEGVRNVHEVDHFLSLKEIKEYYFHWFGMDVNLDWETQKPGLIPIFETKDHEVIWMHCEDEREELWKWVPPAHGATINFDENSFKYFYESFEGFVTRFYLMHNEGYRWPLNSFERKEKKVNLYCKVEEENVNE